ncbi:acyltransferase [Methylobacterium platani]|uniref:Acetyltransferase n=1 Tax=Methylobacterium platani TaxID=427683 RepID=A0A179S1T1_9HYPH|nr:acyltransferase [Methylobacterium platani]OAS15966.1 hypothetical protein A5481_29000 [Methylobacterium platani]
MPITNVSLDEGASLTHPDLVDLAGCRIGAGARVGPFVQIRPGSSVGPRCKVSSHSVLGARVELGEGVFVGHGVVIGEAGEDAAGDAVRPTRIGAGASLGSRATVLPGVAVGRGAMVGAGAVVAADLPDFALAVGVPARVIGDARDRRGLSPHDPAGRLDEAAAG